MDPNLNHNSLASFPEQNLLYSCFQDNTRPFTENADVTIVYLKLDIYPYILLYSFELQHLVSFDFTGLERCTDRRFNHQSRTC